MADGKDSNAIAVPFVFVRHGDPLPVEWMARHPGWVRFPATLVPRPVPRQVVPGAAWDVAGAGEPSGFGPTSRPVSVGAPVVRRRRVPVRRLPTGRRDAEDPVAAYLRISKAMDGAASAYLAAERTGAAPKALSTSPEGLPPPLTAAATAGSAGDGRAQAGVGGGRRSPAASDVLDLWTGTGVADIAGAVMADAGPVGPATAKADAPAAPVHIDVAPNGVEHGATGDAAAVAGSDQATKADTVFSPGREGYHSYQAGPYIVAPAYMHVMPEEMADQMSRFAVPGQSPDKPVESGQTYLVFYPGL